MGSMSASDAAPLPRLGEVYFDVRGESRSMRLSWYADTGVAVFSIWQGGTCTGTFRLPIADLPRMVQALQRGPHGEAKDPRDARGPAERGRTDHRGGHAREPGPEPDTGYSEPRFSGAHADHPDPYGAEPDREYLDRPGRAHRGEPATAAYREDQAGEYAGAGAHGGYQEEAHQAYADDSVPGGYRGERSGYESEPDRGYQDEPTGVYRGDLLSHGYQDEPPARYRETDYRDDPLTGRYPADDPHPARYQDDPLTGSYHEDPHPARYAEDPLAGDYPDGPQAGDYPTGPAASGYPDDAGYPDDIDSRDYPPSSGNAGYSPARPYVTPPPGSGGPAAEGRGHGRRRAASREESDPSPDSFPYGRPPAEREPRERGR